VLPSAASCWPLVRDPMPGRVITRRRVIVGLGAVVGTGALGMGGIFAYDRYAQMGLGRIDFESLSPVEITSG
jgi:hypothetical protein